MVSDVIEFSTNQKTVNLLLVFQRYLDNGKEFFDEIFCIAFRKVFRIFTIDLLPIGPPFNANEKFRSNAINSN